MPVKRPAPGDLEPIETASRDELQALQLERLRWSLRHAYENVPHYRRAFAAADHLSLAEALSREADVQRKLGFAHDYQEGVTAFFAKRAAQFKDR